MFSKLALFTVATMAVFVAAAPAPSEIENSCNTGPVQCCNSVVDSDSDSANLLVSLLGLVLGPITAQVGLQCSPLVNILGGGSSCSSQPVCCSDNSFNGLIAIGCSPINLNL